jgi:hypothetical protein
MNTSLKTLILSSAILIAMNSFAADKPATINCLDKTVQAKHQKLCHHVVDEMKYRSSTYSVIDCTKDSEDSYAKDVCQKVNPTLQKTLRKQPKS